MTRRSNAEALPKQPLAFLAQMSRPYRGAMWGAILCSAVAQALSTSVAYIFGRLVDAANSFSSGHDSLSALIFWVVLYPAFVGGNELFWRGSGFIGMRWATGLRQTSYEKLFEYLSQHSSSFFSRRFAGALGSSINNAVNGLGSLVEAFLWNYLPTMIAATATIALALYTNRVLGLVFLFWIALIIPLNLFFAKRIARFSEASAANQSKLRGYTIDIISNIAAVHSFARRSLESQNVSLAATEQRRFALRSWVASEILLLVNSVILTLLASSVVAVSFHFWQTGLITLGQFVTSLTLVGNIAWVVLFIGQALNSFSTNIGEVRNGLSDIISPHGIVDASGALPLIVTDASISFTNISFNYDSRKIFDNFSLNIAAGERVGIIGHSGAGKTTLVALLLRQHDVGEGGIFIDGQNVASVSLESLRQAIAAVPQEPYLFHRTIRENILYGRRDATDAEIEAAAEQAEAHGFISTLPEGYDTIVGERGVRLSGGERQRIAIARAILKAAPILVLDEATSALDSEGEGKIQKALKKLMKGKTVLAIAHRLSTIREMDRIIVIEKGSIVEEGSHDQLLSQRGVYARIWNHQAGGFLVDDAVAEEEGEPLVEGESLQ